GENSHVSNANRLARTSSRREVAGQRSVRGSPIAKRDRSRDISKGRPRRGITLFIPLEPGVTARFVFEQRQQTGKWKSTIRVIVRHPAPETLESLRVECFCVLQSKQCHFSIT